MVRMLERMGQAGGSRVINVQLVLGASSHFTVLDGGELIVAEEAPPEIPACCVPTLQKGLSC